MAKENSVPVRVLAGQKTLLARDIHDLRYEPVHDEIYATNPRAQAILVFRGGAQGEEPPLRVIQGPHTQLVGSEVTVERLDVDAMHNEIFVPSGDSILVFPREANGDVAPMRVIRGPETQLKVPGTLAVDPVHNLIVVGQTFVPAYGPVGGDNIAIRLSYHPGSIGGGFVIFNRTDSGNAKPVAVIQGPRTGIVRINQMQVYPPKGWIIATQPGRGDAQEPEGAFVGVWSIHDNGDVPPRWMLRGSKSLLVKPRGVTLDPAHKELIVADMRLNAVLTYYFPEIF